MSSKEYKDAIEKDPSFEARIAAALEIEVPALKMPELPIAEDSSFEERIASALEIDVPELEMPELPEIDTANVTALPRRRFSAPQWLAVAATVAVVAVLGFRTLGVDSAYPSLADEIVAHLDHEPYSLVVTDVPVNERRLSRVVPASLADMNHDAGLITYAQTCIINGKYVPHLVIQGQHGPVTILLMPDEEISGPQSLTGHSVNGVILPVGDGSIAIIGEAGEDLEPIEQNLRDSVRWDTT